MCKSVFAREAPQKNETKNANKKNLCNMFDLLASRTEKIAW